MRNYLQNTEVIATNFKKQISGVTSSIIQLIPKQQAFGTKVHILGFGLPKHIAILPIYALLNLWKAPKGRKFYIWHARRHTEMILGLILRDILKAKIKLVFTSAAQRPHKPTTHWLMGKMDKVIVTGKNIIPYIKCPYVVIPHGIDTETFSPKDKKNATYTIGCFGRIRYLKGTDIFIDSMIELLPKYPKWKAVFAGLITPQHQSYANELFEKIKKAKLEDRIIYLGEITKDINTLYQNLDLYVAPSRNEGFGLTVLEAMSSGVAVIASNKGAFPEIITRDSGAIMPELNHNSLSSLCCNLIQDHEKLLNMGIKARQKVVEKYGIINEVMALDNLYNSLLEL